MTDIKIIDILKYKIINDNKEYQKLIKQYKDLEEKILNTDINLALLKKEQFEIKQKIEILEKKIVRNITNG